MKVVILAGGFPSTLINYDEKIPKPMAEVGGKPLLWHIMKQYAYYGYNDFIICTGYKGEIIKDYFINFYVYQSDITVDLYSNNISIHRKQAEDWKVTIIDTGNRASIMERLLKIQPYIEKEKVLVTYGDCLSDINICNLVNRHNNSQGIATFVVAHPTGRNEILTLDESGNYVGKENKNVKNEAWVNACSMIIEPAAFRYFCVNDMRLQPKILDVLARSENIQLYYHEGFWAPVETIHDKTIMEKLWENDEAPWKVWDD